MDDAQAKRAIRIAQYEALVGWSVVLATFVARVTTIVLQLTREHLDLELFIESIFKAALLLALVLLYRRSVWPSYFMLAIWPIGYALTLWRAHPPPAIAALGLLVGAAFFFGAHGMRTLRALHAIQNG